MIYHEFRKASILARSLESISSRGMMARMLAEVMICCRRFLNTNSPRPMHMRIDTDM